MLMFFPSAWDTTFKYICKYSFIFENMFELYFKIHFPYFFLIFFLDSNYVYAVPLLLYTILEISFQSFKKHS